VKPSFYVDRLGRLMETPVKNALRRLAELADFLKVLGCYPRQRCRKPSADR
jgi:prephenate dehydratase